MRELARAAYPVVLMQLTGQKPLEKHTHIDFVHPAARERARRNAPAGRETT